MGGVLPDAWLDAQFDLVKMPLRPPVIVGLDVETTTWDDKSTFAAQNEHFAAGWPCGADHTTAAGRVCQVGYAVFRRIDESAIYHAEDPISLFIKLPDDESIAKKAFHFHGITQEDCKTKGQDFETVILEIVKFLRQGASIVAHNLAHETLVLCRETQHSSLPVEDASLLLKGLYNGQCTSLLAKKRNNGYFRKLSDEFRACFGDEVAALWRDHDAGHDAAKSARVYLHHIGAVVANAAPFPEAAEGPCHKKPRIA